MWKQDTVEDRLQQVQAREQRMISGTLTDDEVRSARIQDLKMLFTWDNLLSLLFIYKANFV